MRTYWCDICEKCVDIDMKVSSECKCGKIFGVSSNISNYINMRTTLSGTTKMEFSTTTMDESVNSMNKGK